MGEFLKDGSEMALDLGDEGDTNVASDPRAAHELQTLSHAAASSDSSARDAGEVMGQTMAPEAVASGSRIRLA